MQKQGSEAPTVQGLARQSVPLTVIYCITTPGDYLDSPITLLMDSKLLSTMSHDMTSTNSNNTEWHRSSIHHGSGILYIDRDLQQGLQAPHSLQGLGCWPGHLPA